MHEFLTEDAYMYHPYEEFLQTDDSMETRYQQALTILNQGWIFNDYPALDLYKPIDWRYNSEDERSWNYSKHSFLMLDKILSAHSNMRDKLFLLLPAVFIALDWSENHVDLEGSALPSKSKFAWYDMAVGMRAQRLAYILDAARSHQLLNPAQDQLLWQGLKSHQHYLADDSNIKFHNNHGYYQAAGQIAMGRRFQNKDESMAEAMNQGIERFKKMLAQQFTPDGVHKEHSPQYHYMVYRTLNSVIRSRFIEDKSVKQLASKIESALAWFVLPDSTLANFGDSNRIEMESETDDICSWRDKAMQYVTTNGASGKLPDQTLKVFEEAGYFIVRFNHNLNHQRYDECSYLAQTAAFHSRTHKHADDLSFIWYELGQNILIDAGRYGYVGKTVAGSDLWKQGYWYSHPSRIYCESTRAHNTLEFDGLDYPRVGLNPYGSAIQRSRQYPNGLTMLETESKHFDSIRRVRVLIYMPQQWLIVYDWFKDNADELHDVRQWFNFAPKLKLLKLNESYSVKLKNDKQLHISSLLIETKSSEVIKGQKEPRLQGWHSPKDGAFEPVSSINYQLTQVDTGSIATLFNFNGETQVAFEKNKVNASGRRLNLAWQDTIGKHQLNIDRSVNIDISVAYSVSY